MATDDRKHAPFVDLDTSKPPASPYGPQPNGVDDAAGGADSSPFETMSSDERAKLMKKKRPQDESPDDRS